MTFVDPSKHRCIKKEKEGMDVRWIACSYLCIQKIMCDDGQYHSAWYCSCEDDMCSGCIPTFKEHQQNCKVDGCKEPAKDNRGYCANHLGGYDHMMEPVLKHQQKREVKE